MAGREPVEVTVEADGREIAAGTLWIHERGGQSATFRYAASYLEDPGSYDLDPALPKSAGVFHTPPAAALFGAFADSAPDRWGENLMRREERERARAASATPRTLGKADFLLGSGTLTANTDDHLRNHAFLREPHGWALSPAYDLNPNPDNPVRLTTSIDLDDASASIDLALAVCDHFRLSQAAARDVVSDVERATAGWREVAGQLGLPGAEIERMTAAYETGQRRLARAVAPA